MSETEKASGGELVNVEELAIEQRAALELLAVGKSVTEAARTAGVSRGMVYYWLKTDAKFKAIYNQWREESEESTRSRMLAVLDKAAGALEKSFEAGDGRTALQFLKGMGMTRPPEKRETDAEEIPRKDEVAKEHKKLAAKRDRAKLMEADFAAEFGV
jgi:AcrR family transcriptional regulator